MDLCVYDPVRMIYNGLECFKTYDHTSAGLKFTMYATTIFLLLLGIYVYTSRPQKSLNHMRAAVFLYCILTSTFSFSRSFFDIGRVLVLTAALHNSCEWAIWGGLIFEYSKIKKFHVLTFGFIFFVIITSTLVNDLFVAFLFEQMAGIVCDYFLLLTFFYRYRDSENTPFQKRTFLMGFIASASHFGTIFTLIIIGVNLNVNLNTVLEWISLFSTYPTFVVYALFINRWEHDYIGSQKKEGSKISKDIKTSAWVTILIISIFLSVATFGGLLFIPHCPVNNPYSDPSLSSINVYTVIKTDKDSHLAMKEELKSLMEDANENGAIKYEVMQNIDTTGEFKIDELWENYASYDLHKKSVSVIKFFNDPYYNSLKVGDMQTGAWNSLALDRSTKLSFVFETEAKCDSEKVWAKVENFAEPYLIFNAKKTFVLSETEKEVELNDGRKLGVRKVAVNKKDKLFTQQITKEVDFKSITEEFRLSSDEKIKATKVSVYVTIEAHEYSIDQRKTIQKFYLESIVPYLSKSLSC